MFFIYYVTSRLKFLIVSHNFAKFSGHIGIPGLLTQVLDGLWTLDPRPWPLDHGRRTPDSGRWTLDATLRKLGYGHWILLLTGSEQNQNQVFDSA